MQKGSCDENNHAWSCKQTSGLLNETTTFRLLTVSEANNLKNDESSEVKICPEGVVVCSQCGEHFNKNKANKPLLPDFKSINENLKE